MPQSRRKLSPGGCLPACGLAGFQDQYFKSLELENLRLPGCQYDCAGCRRVFARSVESIPCCRAGGKLECFSNIQGDLRAVRGWIAQYENSRIVVPGCPSIDLPPGGIAADPVGVTQNGGVIVGPFRGAGQHIPIVVIQEMRRNVKFLQLCACSEE